MNISHRENVSNDLDKIMVMGQRDPTNKAIINANEKVYGNLEYITEAMKREGVIPDSQEEEPDKTQMPGTYPEEKKPDNNQGLANPNPCPCD